MNKTTLKDKLGTIDLDLEKIEIILEDILQESNTDSRSDIYHQIIFDYILAVRSKVDKFLIELS